MIFLQTLIRCVQIPKGTFLMGSSNSEDFYQTPQATVTIKSFLIGKYPVLYEQWDIVRALEPVNIKLDPDPRTREDSLFWGQTPSGKGYPVDWVDWAQCQEFCDRLSRETGLTYRLPTEAEWEYACRAGSTTEYSYGDEPSYTDMVCRSAAGEAGSFRPSINASPNSFGVCDMHGNVWEWCQDGWSPHLNYVCPDGAARLEDYPIKVIRGGAWYSEAYTCRSAFRIGISQSEKGAGLGFRVAVSLDE